MTVMQRSPLLAGGPLPADITSEEWTYTLAHYEEAFPRLEWMRSSYANYGPLIVHRHPHTLNGETPPCNDQCVYVWWT